jgi:hypothetical protein
MEKGSPSYEQNSQLVQSWGLVHSGLYFANLKGAGPELTFEMICPTNL